MLKKIFIILFIFCISISIYSFDHSSYFPSTLNEIIKFTKHDANRDESRSGMIYFGEKYRFVIKLSDFPNLINFQQESINIKSAPLTMFTPTFLDLFTYKLKIETEGQKVLFLFQDKIVKYLEKEITLGDDVELFAILGSYVYENSEITILVNEFNSKKQLFGKNQESIPEINNKAEKYIKKAFEKIRDEDHSGAILEFDKAIKLDAASLVAFYNRAMAKYLINDFNSAISDFDIVIELDSDHPNVKDAYYYRGLCKIEISDSLGACKDWTKSKELGHIYATQQLEINCIKSK